MPHTYMEHKEATTHTHPGDGNARGGTVEFKVMRQLFKKTHQQRRC